MVQYYDCLSPYSNMTVIQLLWLGNDTMKIQETFLRLWRFGLCLILLTKIFLSSVDKRNDNKEFILKEEGNVLGAEANDSFRHHYQYYYYPTTLMMIHSYHYGVSYLILLVFFWSVLLLLSISSQYCTLSSR